MAADGKYLAGIKRLKHSGVRLDKGDVIYVDPYGVLTDSHDADFVFITHIHYDHYSPEDIKRIFKEDTVFVAPAEVAAKLTEAFSSAKIKIVESGDILSLGSLCVEVLPAYNIGKQFHPKEKGCVGYILRCDDGSYYFPGDIDAIPEFLAADADVFFVPIGGTYTMNPEEAAAAVEKTSAKIAIPYHYGDIEGIGKRSDGAHFISLLKNVKGVEL
ncbi:MAG TPA: MBL fold metallo-hydrolase [Candidatus Acidoferrum sp.]|nr:MBL fold metallo-hydrolase [Candidatus Acidoferrum sp.]